jgi:hypothetical protein
MAPMPFTASECQTYVDLYQAAIQARLTGGSSVRNSQFGDTRLENEPLSVLEDGLKRWQRRLADAQRGSGIQTIKASFGGLS